MERTQMDLTRGPILKSLVLFALPLLVSNLFQQMYNTVDTMIVGNALGEAALASMGVCSTLYHLLIGFAIGMGTGMSIVVARSFGSGDETRLKRSVAGTLVIGFGMALLLSIVSQWLLLPLLRLLDTPEDVLVQGYAYMSVIVKGGVVTFAYNICAALLRAIGNSFMPLIFLIISSVLNVGLDLLFVIELDMGVAGAAYATVAAQGVSVMMCAIYILRKVRMLIPQRAHFAPDRMLYRELATQGLSVGCMNALVYASTLVVQRSINHLGMLTIAAHTAARRINAFGVMPCGVAAEAVATFVSQNRGAGHRDRILRGLAVGCGMVLAWTAVATVVIVMFAPMMVRMISGSEEAMVVDRAVRYLRFNVPFYAVLGALFLARHSLQSLGQKVVPLVSSVVELAGKIVFAFLAIPRMGYDGVILCEPLLWCIMTVLLVAALVRHPYLRGKE